jgi:hypothetical protein
MDRLQNIIFPGKYFIFIGKDSSQRRVLACGLHVSLTVTCPKQGDGSRIR